MHRPGKGGHGPLHRRSARPSALAFALLPLPAVSSAQTMFRFPASQLGDPCGNGGCEYWVPGYGTDAP